jgi:hypothetical protein
MCTVTFIPNRSGFTLTHNRDEAPSRSSVSIAQDDHKQDDLIVFPRDSKAGGTWFATSESGKTVCLLNGAFLKHHHNPPYKRSRGLMVFDFFDYHDPNRFFHEYELDGMEPFTLIFARPGVLTELRWDEHQRHITHLPPDQPRFWCSSTLYPPAIQNIREEVFQNWLQKNASHTPRDITRLHLKGSVNDPANNFVMLRDRVRTVSITQVVRQKKYARMRFLELLENNRDERLVFIKNR